MEHHFKFVIIGAGVIGLSIAEKLSQTYRDILVVDKEKKFGQHSSSRNSEVIHSGFYYPHNSLKAKLCVKGNIMIYDFCKKYNIPYKKCGKLVVANNESEIQEINKIFTLAKKNGVKNIKILSKKDSIAIEPMVKSEQSLWVPSTGIFDSHLFMSKLENLSISRDVSFLYNLEVESLSKNSKGFLIGFTNENFKIKAEYVINCAGLWSHEIANKIIDNNYSIEYYKGDYFKAPELKGLKHLIYPVPSQLSLGVHTVLNLNEEVLLGPNAYKVKKINYLTDDTYKDAFINQGNKLVSKTITKISQDYSGIRPKIEYKNKINDFIINEDSKGLFNLIGIDSPGLTSSLAIAEYINNKI